MSEARAAILERLRRLARGGPDAAEARIAAPPAHPCPRVEGDLVARFTARAEAQAAVVHRLARMEEVPAAVAAVAAGATPVCPDPSLAALPWPAGGRPACRPPSGDDRITLTRAFAGVAETGSLVFASGVHAPTGAHFLPETECAVLEADRILPHLEAAWALLAAELGAMPRTVNLVSGPSRTADVEQTIQLGAHGPRALHILIVG
ncbi:LutC/YkgG family protein [Inmirania thermothiophila]|uniref:L-lactate dehydrogenase complex protein LldG n=1 Tax=Inmirania thermothiophila TaxID=1750597 RepID=A0A3N1Y701_9GAMM|nr:LUD domain-containing protein [Inmirania thermothiophila]ROR34298.1 L-lactate dehydrogenase complex protein LldG [Inmirania thermothiophila]